LVQTAWRVEEADVWAGENWWRIVDDTHRVVATCNHRAEADEIVHHHNARLKRREDWLYAKSPKGRLQHAKTS
jgi:hypothetical protein